MRIVITLALALTMAAGVTYAQDLQNTLTQPAEGEAFVPDIASTASSRPPVPVLVQTLAEPMAEPTQSDNGPGMIVAHIVNTTTEVRESMIPPQMDAPSPQYWVPVPAAQDFRSMQMVPEPSSILALMFGLGGLASWRYRSRHTK